MIVIFFLGNKRFHCSFQGCQFKTQLRDSLNSHMRKIHGFEYAPDNNVMSHMGGDNPNQPSIFPPMFSLPPIQEMLPVATSGFGTMTSPTSSQVRFTFNVALFVSIFQIFCLNFRVIFLKWNQIWWTLPSTCLLYKKVWSKKTYYFPRCFELFNPSDIWWIFIYFVLINR